MKVRTDSADTAVSRDQYSLQRLQVEVDQFFLRAAHQIISAHRYTVHKGSSLQYVLFYSMFFIKEEGCLHLSTCPSVLFLALFSILSSFPVLLTICVSACTVTGSQSVHNCILKAVQFKIQILASACTLKGCQSVPVLV